MARKKSILIATIGTRDLAFCIAENEWLNLGNDRSPNKDSISEQALVQDHLGLERSSFRLLTEYLVETWSDHQDAIQPIIIGKLLKDENRNLKKIYLVGTNQPESVTQREKDTLYSAHLIKLWIEKKYKIPTDIIEQGKNGENPSDFEVMFAWWKQIWSEIAQETKEETKIILCIKGGVNQSSEAARITALSRFGESTYFYDFIQDAEKNFLGSPSQYTKPFQGRNYLWELKQTEALSLLNRWDYAAVQKVLCPYKDNADEDDQTIEMIWHHLQMAIDWNMADFESFAQSIDSKYQQRTKTWWWTAYEVAYLGVIRFQQGHITEAFFHSFRAVEGLMIEWAIEYYKPHIEIGNNNQPILKKSICKDVNFSESKSWHSYFNNQGTFKLFGEQLEQLLKSSLPHLNREYCWQNFAQTREIRNQIFHRLYKLDKTELFEAWNVNSQKEWENLMLGCLNSLSSQNFLTLKSSSLLSNTHQLLEEKIKNYSIRQIH
ncbi:hypothetical protein [Cyanothece sp. BG0011]|uniref:hypothetical protein n=1 Tax=Cyanothece sp. BG0011 TaxID=2082950 RepID=UPI000D1F5FD8|nr:hypothetical protein [Cyanothece sp. BG0011]